MWSILSGRNSNIHLDSAERSLASRVNAAAVVLWRKRRLLMMMSVRHKQRMYQSHYNIKCHLFPPIPEFHLLQQFGTRTFSAPSDTLQDILEPFSHIWCLPAMESQRIVANPGAKVEGICLAQSQSSAIACHRMPSLSI